MGVMVGQKYRVWIETNDGMVMELNAYAVNLSHTYEYDALLRTHLEMEIIENPVWRPSAFFVEDVRKEQQAAEWSCDYCNRPNPKERTTCVGCGAVRSFIYLV